MTGAKVQCLAHPWVGLWAAGTADLSPALGTAMVRANFAPVRLPLRGGRQ